MGIAVFELGLFPIGMLLGAYKSSVLLQASAEEAFGSRLEARGSRLPDGPTPIPDRVSLA